MCSITAYMILEPVVRGLGKAHGEGASKRSLFMTAAGSVISFNLIYPSPVMVSLSGSPGVISLRSPGDQHPHLARSVRVSLHHRAALPARRQDPRMPSTRVGRARAWAPLMLPMGQCSYSWGRLWEGAKSLANPGIALLMRIIARPLALARDKMQDLIHVASSPLRRDLAGSLRGRSLRLRGEPEFSREARSMSWARFFPRLSCPS